MEGSRTLLGIMHFASQFLLPARCEPLCVDLGCEVGKGEGFIVTLGYLEPVVG